MILLNRQGVYKKTPKKPKKLKSYGLPRKDELRQSCVKSKSHIKPQERVNPFYSTSRCYTEKPINTIISHCSSAFKDRKLDFSKKELTEKIGKTKIRSVKDFKHN